VMTGVRWVVLRVRALFMSRSSCTDYETGIKLLTLLFLSCSDGMRSTGYSIMLLIMGGDSGDFISQLVCSSIT
jgi:hypothetical protein